ncbi:hypothetical protein QUA43_11195, partial [Microcoleus sp. N9_B4]
MNNPIIWLHGDCLSPEGPAFQAHPEAPAIWVWDDALIDEWQLSLKRMVFIYECLLELPVVIPHIPQIFKQKERKIDSETQNSQTIA